jgi:hypothetical protein
MGTPHKTTICPHCGRAVGNRHYVALCPADPEVYAAIGALLADPNLPGMAASTNDYERNRHAPDGQTLAPSADTLARFYGGWAAVCAEYRLTPPSTAAFVCPQCGGSLTRQTIGPHANVCPADPINHERIRLALTIGCEDGQGAGYVEYRNYREAYDPSLPHPDSLRTLLKRPRWTEILDYFGLQPGLRRHQNVAAAQAEYMAQVAERIELSRLECAAVLRSERTGGYGLAVCRERDLPGVYINGRPAVARMIR